MKLTEHLTMGLLWKVAFLALDDNPGKRQSATVIDDTDHQGTTASTDDAAIHDQGQGLLREIGEQGLGDRQKPTINGRGVVLEEAAAARDDTFLVSSVAGSVIGDGGEMSTLRATQAADQGNQGVEMVFLMTSRVRVKELHEALLYGTIAAVRVTHLLLRT